MGLLTNPKARSKLLHIISTYGNILCFLSYVIGFGWFLLLAWPELNHRTYFSENALLPGLVDSHFHNDHGAAAQYEDLKQMLRANMDEKNYTGYNYRIPTPWFASRFREIGLDTYVQNFTFRYPASVLKDKQFDGQNVYGILRAPRAASTEAVILSVPYRPPAFNDDKTNSAIGLMLGVAKSFRAHTFWAKDIIFLITEHESVGMQAWLDAYHHQSNQYIRGGELKGRGGSIQAAINLEIQSDTISRFNLKLHGLNGQLPNLDLVNVAVKLCQMENIVPTIQKRADPQYRGTEFDRWKYTFKTMMSMVWEQATGSPSGNHGLFHKYRIESLTLQGIKTKNAKMVRDYVSMGKVIEGLFRSLNNLLERFHQSFFFYLLPSTLRYVSIGMYMPPFGLLLAPGIVQALMLWLRLEIVDIPPEEESKEKPKEENNEKTKEGGDDGGEHKDEKEENKEKEKQSTDSKPTNRAGYLCILPIGIMAVLFGVLYHNGAQFFIETSAPFRMSAGDGMLWGAFAMSTTAMLFPRILRKRTQKDGHALGSNWQLQKCLGLLVFSAILGCTSAFNISLALILTVVWVPVFTIVRPTRSFILNGIQYLLLFLVSPLALIFAGSVTNCLMQEKYKDLNELWLKTWKQASSAILNGLIESEMFGSITYSVFTLALLPTWLIFWSLMWCEP